jgi:hypothetical protein
MMAAQSFCRCDDGGCSVQPVTVIGNADAVTVSVDSYMLSLQVAISTVNTTALKANFFIERPLNL